MAKIRLKLRCSYVQCDVGDEDQVKAMVDYTVKTYGRLDVIFCNAGKVTTTHDQTILDLDLSEFDKVLRVNARGKAICVKHAARKMVELGIRGAIICTASVTAAMGAQTFTDYSMSKHAVVGLMRCASQQLGVHGIRVNCVSPSAVFTPLAPEVGFPTSEDVQRRFAPFTSLKGVVLTAEHIAEAVVYLATHEFMSGQNLVVDGNLVCFPYDK